MSARPTGTRVRLAELIAMISLGTDLGMGQPMEHVMRQSLIALRLAEQLDLDESTRGVVYYVSLLAWVGCHVDAYEQAKWFGDDVALKADARRRDLSGLSARVAVLSRVGAGRGLLERGRLAVKFVGDGLTPARPSRITGSRPTSSRLRSAWTGRCVTACIRRSSAGTARACPRRPGVRRSCCRRAW